MQIFRCLFSVAMQLIDDGAQSSCEHSHEKSTSRSIINQQTDTLEKDTQLLKIVSSTQQLEPPRSDARIQRCCCCCRSLLGVVPQTERRHAADAPSTCCSRDATRATASADESSARRRAMHDARRATRAAHTAAARCRAVRAATAPRPTKHSAESKQEYV